MKKTLLDTYAELQDRDGLQTLFRKFDTGTWILQFNEDGDCIGQVCVSEENMKIIHHSPHVKAGDGKTKQELP